jgi:hypothetical protein
MRAPARGGDLGPGRVGDVASSTILIDGVDVMIDGTGLPRVSACRLDLPTVSRGAGRAARWAPVRALENRASGDGGGLMHWWV